MVSKCIVLLLWGTNFQHGGKFVPQSSPTMHFDNHLDPVSQPTSKWRIEIYIDSLILLSSCTCARVHFHLLSSIVKLTRFDDKFSLRQILCSNLKKKKKEKNARILSAILLICILLNTKECGIPSVVGHIIVVVTG